VALIVLVLILGLANVLSGTAVLWALAITLVVMAGVRIVISRGDRM
jgi:hypothetical protein